MYIPWTNAMADTWRQTNHENAEGITENYDIIVIHDPQPAGLLHYVKQRDPNALGAKWIWRCHLDTTESLPEVWDFLRGYVQPYDAMVFTMAEYAKEQIKGPSLEVIWPAIDPMSTKNSKISSRVIRDVLNRYEIDPDRPIIAQISRFDPWKDPLGVIDVYRILKEEQRELQLIMVASMANDDPEAWSFYERIVRKAGEDFDIHILTNLNGVGNLEVNTFQSAADVLMQKSIREGFGLVVSEALWKGKAFVGSPVGGIPMQLASGRGGLIAHNTEEFAERIRKLLGDPAAREKLGKAGKEHVRQNFLTTRLIEDHLRLYNRLAAPKNGRAAQATPQTGSRRRGKAGNPRLTSGPDRHVYLGLDLGGTKTLALVATADGEIFGRAVNPSLASASADDIVATLVETGRQAVREAGVDADAIGGASIAAAGAVQPSLGTISWSPHIAAMSDTPVVSMFRALWDLPTAIGNDANLAALGEQRFGAGKGTDNLVFITISTGIGGGIIIGGKPYTGATGYAGEIGHVTVDAHGPYGRSTTPGAWESLCSGTALARIMGERVDAGEPSMLAGVPRDELDAQAIFEAMRAGDALAKSVVADAIEYLGAGFTSLVNMLNPGMVIVGGGLSNEWDSYIAPAIDIMRGQAFAGVGRTTPVVPAALGADAGALGAVALAATLE
jgi:trehalose synthase